MDPQQRVLLEEAAVLLPQPDAYACAGVKGSGAGGPLAQQTAVVVGIAKLGEPAAVAAGNAAAVAAGSSYVGTGRALSAAAGRLSYCFSLRGPAVTVDTACSSSLVGTHIAAGAILAGASSRGLSAGINLPMNWETTAMFAAAGGHLAHSWLLGCRTQIPDEPLPPRLAGMMAPDGRCKALDAAADGYVRSEAAVVLLLQAAAVGCLVAGSCAGAAALLLAGTAVNQDGRCSSLTAPHGPSQQAVVVAAAGAARLTAADLGGVEMHGTGEGRHHGCSAAAQPCHTYPQAAPTCSRRHRAWRPN